MELNRLLEFTNGRERCEFCPDEGCTNICARCEDVKPITSTELREYYQDVRRVLAEAIAASERNWRTRNES